MYKREDILRKKNIYSEKLYKIEIIQRKKKNI